MAAFLSYLRQSRWRVIAPVAAVLTLASCAGNGSADEQKIGVALMRTLTQGNTAICIDSGTYGEPLAMFRTMSVAPEAVQKLLYWSRPGPLKPGRLLSSHELVRDELGNSQSTLPEYDQNGAELPLMTRLQLNAHAHAASLVEPETDARLHATAQAPLAHVHWWPLNRFNRGCGPVYTVSNPVIKGGLAFVTVTAGHQGTIYAFQKKGTDWSTIAQWSNWLY